MKHPDHRRARPAVITETCRTYFGVYRGNGKWSLPNRCDSCPIQGPCFRLGAAPARTHAELDANRATYYAEALAILQPGKPS